VPAPRRQRRSIADAAATAEQRWGKAMQHPLRPRILRYLLAERTTNAMELSRAWRVGVGVLSAHLRYLCELGFITLHRRTTVRGAFVSHYRLSDRADVELRLWRTGAVPATSLGGPHAGQATAVLDEPALEALRPTIDRFLAELAQLGAQTQQRQLADPGRSEPVRLVVLVAREQTG
jgi:DNA-binding PadR family transcriptional regulator